MVYDSLFLSLSLERKIVRMEPRMAAIGITLPVGKHVPNNVCVKTDIHVLQETGRALMALSLVTCGPFNLKVVSVVGWS